MGLVVNLLLSTIKMPEEHMAPIDSCLCLRRWRSPFKYPGTAEGHVESWETIPSLLNLINLKHWTFQKELLELKTLGKENKFNNQDALRNYQVQDTEGKKEVSVIIILYHFAIPTHYWLSTVKLSFPHFLKNSLTCMLVFNLKVGKN